MESIKTIKCNLKTILKKDIDYNKLFGCIQRVNEMVFIGSHFIRQYILYLYHKNIELPKVNSAFIRIAFKLLSKSSRGQKGKTNESFQKFYKLFCRKLGSAIKLSATNLSYMLIREYQTLETAYINNIVLNYLKYLRQYVNESFGVPRYHRIQKEDLHKMSFVERNQYFLERSELMKKKKELLKELYHVKNDIINGTNTSDEKYKSWIDNFRKTILPVSKNLTKDIEKHPFKYLESMLIMNFRLEENNVKLFQPLPLRTEIYDKYVQIDTSAIKDVFNEVHTGLNKNEVWQKYFNIKKFKINGYIFNNLISTDGTQVSISFMKKEDFIRKEKMQDKKTKASAEQKKKLQEDDKKNQQLQKKNKSKEIKKQYEEKKTKMKEDFKKLPKEKQGKIKLQLMLKNNEFNYIEDVIKDKKILKYLKEMFKQRKIVVADCGTRSPLTLLGQNNKRFNYRRCRRLKELKRLKYVRLRQNRFNGLISQSKETKELNDLLTETCKKTTKFSKFMDYVKIKLKFIEKIKRERTSYVKYINKLKWYAYINKRRHEDNLLNELEEVYGKDAIFVIGDWSNKNSPIKGLSMPNMALRRLLKKRFEVYNIDEFRTSKINHLTHEEMKHLKIKVKTKDIKNNIVVKELYSVLTYQMSNKRIGCINRDYNAVLNMLRIVDSLLTNYGRPKDLMRNQSTSLNRCQMIERPKD